MKLSWKNAPAKDTFYVKCVDVGPYKMNLVKDRIYVASHVVDEDVYLIMSDGELDPWPCELFEVVIDNANGGGNL